MVSSCIAPEPPLSADSAARLQRIGQIDHTMIPLLAAVLSGLIAQPALIARHAEALAQIAPADPETGRLIDSLLDHADSLTIEPHDHALESASLAPTLRSRGFRLPDLADLSIQNYDFIARGDPAGIAEAIDLIVELPLVEAALEHAAARFAHDLNDENFAEQQRLVQRRLALRAKLAQMGRARAAL